jgi:hypothetical protein
MRERIHLRACFSERETVGSVLPLRSRITTTAHACLIGSRQGDGARPSSDGNRKQFAPGAGFCSGQEANLHGAAAADLARKRGVSEATHSISGKRVARELTTIIEARGKPRMIVSDNGADRRVSPRPYRDIRGSG